MKLPLTFSADPNTDVWKKPPSHDVFTAPYRSHSKDATAAFSSATITFTCTYTKQFDQAGILFIFHPPESTTTEPPAARKWIKAGIEFFDGSPRLSTVCCDAWADWSIAPLPASACLDDVVKGKESVTICVEKENGTTGTSMWVYCVDAKNPEAPTTKLPMREINWPFGEAASAGWELEVAAAIARPDKAGHDKLEASFSHFDVRWAE
ncbi:hypothetical protein DCS_03394 [Drechmeria coniospora]|uniref:Uncharacterized protein n=1 Tax=Drechmeria coniospora TaxID=98403 RepID=A0A151GH34_DRECN|nr:hypothetical protein DCS_03394 [Drechmeria coniospora]KYK56394.1 hypothetical protein DCS_03394 [Drechmeria coniospora]